MKQRFQILNDPRFHLVYGVTQRFSYGRRPSWSGSTGKVSRWFPV